MVCELGRWSDRQVSPLSVIHQQKEHLIEEWFRHIRFPEFINKVELTVILDVKLGGKSLHISHERARRDGYRPPPFIGGLAVDKSDDVSPTVRRHVLIRYQTLR